VGQHAALRSKLMAACHSSGLGGHSGVPVTYRHMKQLFAWKGMKNAVQEYVQSCLTCQMAKPDRAKSPGLLQPLPVPSGAWHTISLDFVEGLPLSGHADCVMVVVDKFTKYVHFIALKHPYTAASVAQLFLDQIYRLHGMPTALVSNRDKIFTSRLWQELFRLAQVQLKMSTAYHPQTDGQTEQVNQCLETFLRCFVSACPAKWKSWLVLAEFWYNSSFHSAIGRSPFEALFGYAPRHFGIQLDDQCAVPSLEQWLQDRRLMTDLVKQHLNRAVVRMKSQADKGRSERSFEVGDLVFLKLQPYVQFSLAPRSNQKLAFKFFGLFPVV
jgi:transposase InsO family protein